jgi:hypothetical protein
MLCGLDRSWSRDAPTQPPSSPALLYSLAHLEDQLKAAYKLVTEGKFSDALRVFVRMLQVRLELQFVTWGAECCLMPYSVAGSLCCGSVFACACGSGVCACCFSK